MTNQPEMTVPAEGKTSAGKPSSWLARYLIIVAMTVAGLSLLMYPSAAQWFYQWGQSKVTAAYVEQAHAAAPEAREDLLANAQAYNAALPQGKLIDTSYVEQITNPDGIPAMSYNAQLSIDDTGIMARLLIPSIHVDLPIYHGLDDAELAKGIGHIPSSSLPIGGLDTHAVLTGHSGLAEAPLLTDLPKVMLGDTFVIEVLGESLYYMVDKISVVKPDDFSLLQIVPGEDHVTLVTCTPKWINTYRLLVRGTRIPTPPDAVPPGQAIGPAVLPGFPWWLVVIVGGTTISAVASRLLLGPPKGKKKQKSAAPAEEPDSTEPLPADPPGEATAPATTDFEQARRAIPEYAAQTEELDTEITMVRGIPLITT